MKTIDIDVSEIESVKVLNDTEVIIWFIGGGDIVLCSNNAKETVEEINKIQREGGNKTVSLMPLMY